MNLISVLNILETIWNEANTFAWSFDQFVLVEMQFVAILADFRNSSMTNILAIKLADWNEKELCPVLVPDQWIC